PRARGPRGGADRRGDAADRGGARGPRDPGRARLDDGGRGRSSPRAREPGGPRAARGRLLEPRHVPELRAPRRRLRRGGARPDPGGGTMSRLRALLGRASEDDATDANEAPKRATSGAIGPADAVLYGTVIALIAFGVVM